MNSCEELPPPSRLPTPPNDRRPSNYWGIRHFHRIIFIDPILITKEAVIREETTLHANLNSDSNKTGTKREGRWVIDKASCCVRTRIIPLSRIKSRYSSADFRLMCSSTLPQVVDSTPHAVTSARGGSVQPIARFQCLMTPGDFNWEGPYC